MAALWPAAAAAAAAAVVVVVVAASPKAWLLKLYNIIFIHVSYIGTHRVSPTPKS